MNATFFKKNYALKVQIIILSDLSLVVFFYDVFFLNVYKIFL